MSRPLPDDADARLVQALQAAQGDHAGFDDIVAICADAARQIGVAEITIDAMTTALQPDQLQRRLDDLLLENSGELPTFTGDLPAGLIDLPTACAEHDVHVQTANGWWRKNQIPRLGKKVRPQGGYSNVTSLVGFLARKDSPPNRGGRPPKPA